MSLFKHLWVAFDKISEVASTLEGEGTLLDAETPEYDSSQIILPPSTSTKSEHDYTPGTRSSATAISNDSQQSITHHPLVNDADAAEITTGNKSDSQPSDNTQRRSSDLALNASPEVEASCTHQACADEIRQLRIENARHLTWQDRASMAVKEAKEEVSGWKLKARAVKAAALRTEAVMRGQISTLQRQARASEIQRTWILNDHNQAATALESLVGELRDDLEAQKEIAEQAAAEAEARYAEAEARYTEAQTSYEDESKKLQDLLNDRDVELCRLRRVDHQVKTLQAECRRLESERREVDTRVSDAEGRAKGLQDQLKAAGRRTQHLESLDKMAEDAAIDRAVRSFSEDTTIYPVERPENEETSPEEERSSVSVEGLKKEKRELQAENDSLKLKIKESHDAWEAEKKSQKTGEDAIRKECNKLKQDAMIEELKYRRATAERGAKEQEIRDQCQAEKERALAEQREQILVEWESLESSMKAQYATKLKSHTSQEVQRLLCRAKGRSKVKRSQVKNVVRRAVSCGVQVGVQAGVQGEVEFIGKKFQNQFEKKLSDYKTQFEAEHSKSQKQSEPQKAADPTDQTSFDREIKKKDFFIKGYQERWDQAKKAKREADDLVKKLRAENARLGGQITAYEIQESFAVSTSSEVQAAPQYLLPQVGETSSGPTGNTDSLQIGSSTSSVPTSSQVPNAQPVTAMTQSDAAVSEQEPFDFDIDSIDFSDPIWRNIDPDVDFNFD